VLLNLQFLGGAGTITGSRYLLEADDVRVLVDCGLFQGSRALRARNWQAMPVDPAEVDAVFLTHAHLDHAGGIARLVSHGFDGPIFATPPTADLVDNLLLDAAQIQEHEAEYANYRGFSKHRPARPLFTTQDAKTAIKQLRGLPFHQPFTLAPQLNAQFRRSGHLLGASSVLFTLNGDLGTKRVFFSGDLGRSNSELHSPPEPLPAVDYLICEATYGDRKRPDIDVREALADIVNRSAARDGALIIPVFAAGRMQDMLWLLKQLEASRKIPSLPVFVDSPLGVECTGTYLRFARETKFGALGQVTGERVWPTHTDFCANVVDSKNINMHHGACIILSSSGMATGGRVLFHLRKRLPDPRTTVLFVGYQASGTRGRLLLDGAPEIKIHGRYIPVNAQICELQGVSGHADQTELLAWIDGAEARPGEIFVTHGEPEACDGLVDALRGRGYRARAARDGERVVLA
jgi:metallo-beta-lactamase family protein